MSALSDKRSRRRPVGTLLVGTWLAVSGSVAGSQPGSYPGAGDAGAAGARPPMGYPQQPQQQQQQRPPQDPRQQQQQQQGPPGQQQPGAYPYRGPGGAPGQPSPYGSQPQYGGSGGPSSYGSPQGYGQPPSQQQQPPQQLQQPPQQYGSGAGGYYGGYPSAGGPQAPYGRPAAPSQQQQQQEGGGLFSRLANRFKGEGGGGPGQQAPQSQYGGYPGLQPPASSQYGRQGVPGGAGGPPGGQQRPPSSYQWPSGGPAGAAGAGALQPLGPSRGPIGQAQQGAGGQYGRQPLRQGYGSMPPSPQSQQQQQQQQGGGEGGGIWNRIREKVFQGEGPETTAGPPSFRPKGVTLVKRQTSAQGLGMGAAAAYGAGPNGFGGMPYPGYGGVGMMGGMPGAPGSQEPGPQGPGKPEALAVDGSVVLVLKSNELERKKRKFAADGMSKLQVLTNFDQTLTQFTSLDGSRPSLKTTDVLELNSQGMLPEAAKKVRYLRSEFKRRMDAEGKEMSPADRVRALEEHLRKVYATVTQEGGMHLNSIGPSIEPQLGSIPLRAGINDMLGALAYRGIPLTIYCAGYGNVVMEVIKRGAPKIVGPNGSFSPSIRIISNYFRPDETMTIAGMFDAVPLIHEANKNGRTIAEFFKGANFDPNALAARPNVLLLGSDLSDLALAQGLPGAAHGVISVGFLKMEEDFLEKFPRYANAFDAVVLGDGDADGDMAFVNEILHEITT